MAETLQEIVRYRGDTAPDRFIAVDSSGAVLNITVGYQFKLTVDSRKDPSDNTTKKFDVVADIVDGPNGVYEFRPSSVQTDLTPATYYYDIQTTDPAGFIKTIEKGKYIIRQDITK